MPDSKKISSYQNSLAEKKSLVVKEYAALVKKIAGRFSYRLPPDIDIEDLIQVGMIGLMESIDRFDASKDAHFKTYAEYRIRGAMLDELRSRDWIPRSVRSNAHKLNQAFISLRKKGIVNPDNQQLAEELGLTDDEFNKFLLRNISISLLSLDNLGKSNTDSKLNILEALPDDKIVDIEEQLVQQEVNQKLAAAIKNLSKRDQLILSLSFKEELNLKEIAAVLEITEARVCQIRTRLISYLRSHLSD